MYELNSVHMLTGDYVLNSTYEKEMFTILIKIKFLTHSFFINSSYICTIFFLLIHITYFIEFLISQHM